MYQEWIEANVQEGYGKCVELTLAMQEAFPELKRVRGHYHCWVWGAREHWWLTTPDGVVVDPTADQFPSQGLGEYVEWDGEEPTGICWDCGEYCYEGREFCSERCQERYMAYLYSGAL